MKRIVLQLLILIIVFSRCLAGNPPSFNLHVYGTVYDNNEDKGYKEKLSDVHLLLSVGDSTVLSLNTDEHGRYSINMPLNKKYLLQFIKKGYITKSVIINTKHIPLAFRGYAYEFGPLKISLLRSLEGLEYSILQEPVTRIVYNLKKSAFDYDIDYTRSRKSVIDSLYTELVNRAVQNDSAVADYTGKTMSSDEKDEDNIVELAKAKAQQILVNAKRLAFNNQPDHHTQQTSLSETVHASSGKTLMNKQQELHQQQRELMKLKLELSRIHEEGSDSMELSQKEQAIRNVENLIKAADREIELLIRQLEIQSMELQKTHFLMIGAGSLCFLLIIIILLLYRHSRLKSEQKALYLKHKLLRSQMNPHFIFNSLNSIQNYILKNDIQQSTKYLASFSSLIRMILDNSREEYIRLDREIKTLKEYLGLQELRFKDKFKYTLQVSPDIDLLNFEIPPMLIQPFVENAIEHGVGHMKQGGKVAIVFSHTQNDLLITIADNGIGRRQSASLKDKEARQHQSMATQITKERIRVINRQGKMKIDFFIQDNTGNSALPGTEVTFKIRKI